MCLRSVLQVAGNAALRLLLALVPRPTWARPAERLRTATRVAQRRESLDSAVLAVYGWPSDLADDEILKRLIALNLERAQSGARASRE